MPDSQENAAVQEQVKPDSQDKAIDETKVKEFIYNLQMQQNFGLGAVSGLAGSILGAIIWAIVTALTNYQIGWMAVGVGFLVGISVRKFGKGIDKQFGYLGAVLSLFGCLLGNLLTVIIAISKENSTPIISVMSGMDYSKIPNILIDTFHPMDVLFYALAIYEGYKFSFKQITQTELESLKDKA